MVNSPANPQTGKTHTVNPLTLAHPDCNASVQFVWVHDRFDHAIEFDATKLRSVSGPADECWPDSPPIQQLSIETVDARPVALGVGGAGTSHWSLSVEPIERGFKFDWACRAKSAPVKLGTTYQSGSNLFFEAIDETEVSCECDRVHIQPVGAGGKSGTYRWQYRVVVCQDG